MVVVEVDAVPSLPSSEDDDTNLRIVVSCGCRLELEKDKSAVDEERRLVVCRKKERTGVDRIDNEMANKSCTIV